uniref:CN hydrolase domain-containing protein n=1 Tax=Strigamia maritima TaxID=126957 RepID=T1JDU7_STRMM
MNPTDLLLANAKRYTEWISKAAQQSCGRVPITTPLAKFDKLSLTGQLETDVVYPSIVKDDLQPLSAKDWNFSIKNCDEKKSQSKIELIKEGKSIIIASLYARLFDRDFELHCSLLLLLIVVTSTDPSSETYRAASVEYEPYFNLYMNPNDIMVENAKRYADYASKAAEEKAIVVVFPEYGIRTLEFDKISREAILPETQTVPDPKEVSWNPCLNPTEYNQTDALHILSCAATNNSIAIVANILSREECKDENDPNCPSDGHYLYNTNIVFDKNGTLIARYHKNHLFGEGPILNSPEEAEYVTFNIDGIEFATFICFDIIYKDPAVELVRDYGIKNFILTTAWVTEKPFYLGPQTYSSWARGLGVNLIASNYYKPQNSSIGSGIYSSQLGALNETFDISRKGQLLIADLPTHPSPVPEENQCLPPIQSQSAVESTHNDTNNSYNLFIMSHKPSSSPVEPIHKIYYQSLINFTAFYLKESQGNVNLCQNGACCNLVYNLSSNNDLGVYALLAYDGLHPFDKYKFGMQTCSVMRCENENDIESCGRVPNTTPLANFDKLTLTAELEADFVFPSVVKAGSPDTEAESESGYLVHPYSHWLMTYIVLKVYIALTCLLVLLMFLLTTADNSETYRAATVEYEPYFEQHINPNEILIANAKKYAEYASEAAQQKAIIVVFPEYGLPTLELWVNSSLDRHVILPYLQTIPDPKETEYVTFIIDEIEFASFICFDIMYKDPAVELVRDHGIKNIIFSTAWNNKSPFLLAPQLFSSWARGLGVNLIVSNYYKPQYRRLGTGIYSSQLGALNETFDISRKGQLLIADLIIDPTPVPEGFGMAIPTSTQMLSAALCVLLYIQLSVTSNLDKSKYIVTIGRPSKDHYLCATQICCNGITTNKPNPNAYCCGNKTYNPKTHFCCGFIVSQHTSDKKCCDSHIYNSKTHNCNPYVIKVTVDDGELTSWTSDPDHYVVTPITKGTNHACGKEIINYKTHICCNGKPVPITTDSAHCCGNKSYNPKVNFCCSSQNPPTILPPVHHNEDLCCKGKPYNGSIDTCIEESGKIIKLPDSNHQLCNDQIVDNRKKICCSEAIDVQGNFQQKRWIIAKQKKEHTECCGNVSFSLAEEICCQKKLIPRNGIQKCCYGIGPYDPMKDTCCRTHNYITVDVKSKLYKNRLGKCCYIHLYDETKEACCGITVAPKPPANQCGCCAYNVNGTKATLDELINAYKPSIDRITVY